MTIFLIADSHFDALNYMKHVFPRKEFKDNGEMNRVMIRIWNSVVDKWDTVISIGDFCYTDPRIWLRQLNGNKILIRGNHDNWCEGYAGEDHMILHTEFGEFYLVHDPANIPEDWKGWSICGHHHVALPEYPQFDRKRKIINVAAELINYTPVPLQYLIEKIKQA